MSTDHTPVFRSIQKINSCTKGLRLENLTIPSYQMKNIYKEENKKKGLKCGKSIL